MKNKIFFFLLLNGMLTISLYSQNICDYDNNFENLTQADWDFLEAEEITYVDWVENCNGCISSAIIPTVVHVLYQDESEIVDESTIQLAIDKINSDLAGGLGGFNTGIQLGLATINDQGKCTTGIEYEEVSPDIVFNSSNDEEWKPLSMYDVDHYLNIWICNFTGNASTTNGLLNQIPTNSDYDGITIRRETFLNTLDLGHEFEEAMSHEVGHYFGLFHVWDDYSPSGGCGGSCHTDDQHLTRGDRVADTERCLFQVPFSNCDPVMQCTTCDNPNDDVYPKENFMSYAKYCKTEFTEGQAIRMWWFINQFRSELLNQQLTSSCLDEGQDIFITEDEIWSSDNYIFNQNVIVQSGSNLTIDAISTVYFCKDKGITVQPGATLDLRGTLTSCEGQWKGIEVWGTDNANISFPTPGNGKLITQLGSVIENAGTGIFLGGPIIGGNYINTGGELEAYGTTFINNTKSIRIPPSNLALKKYPADIVNCEFNSEGIFQFHSFIDLRGVQSVDIAGCNFNYTGPAMLSAAPFGYGIFASDASMNLTPNIISGTSGPIADESNFNGLSYGVYITKVFANRSFTVEKANFTNCYTGIYNGGMNVGKILYNTFNFGEVPDPAYIINDEDAQMGIFLQGNITTLEVQENEFLGIPNSTFNTLGILADNTGSQIKTIRRNTFENLTISNLATRANGEETPEDGRGLRYACNDFGSSQYDVIVPKEAADGFLLNSKVNELQATMNEDFDPVSAGNIFSNPDVQYGDFNNEQEDEDDFILYRYFTEPENPDDALGVEAIESDESYCDLEYCEAPCPPNDDETNITHLDDATDKFNDGKGTNTNATTAYEQGPSSSQHGEQLLLLIATSATQMAEATDQALYILAANDDPSLVADLLWWINAQETYMTDVWLAGEYAVRGQWSTTHQILNAIPSTYNLTTGQIAEYQNIVSVFNAVANEDIHNLSSTTTNTLINIRNTDEGNAQLLASNILSLNGIETLPEYFMPNLGPIRPRSSKLRLSQETTIFPNPAAQKLNVVWDEEKGESVLFKIYSVGNSLTFSGSTEAGKLIDVAHLSKGLYFVTLQYENGEESTHKILIIR